MKLTFEELRATGALPSPRGVGLAILRLTSREDYSQEELAQLVRSDGALTGRLLHLANSVRASGVKPITTIEHATLRLGAVTVRNLALGFSLLSTHRSGRCRSFDHDRYWSESLGCAVFAQNLARFARGVAPAEAFVCGLLARIGVLALASTHPEEYAEILERCAPHSGPRLADEEERNFAITHHQVSRALLLDWGLPESHGGAVLKVDDRAPVGRTVPRLDGTIWAAARIAESCMNAARLPRADGIGAVAALFGLQDAELAAACDLAAAEWREWSNLLDLPLVAPLPSTVILAAAPVRPADRVPPVPAPADAPSSEMLRGTTPDQTSVAAGGAADGLLVLCVDDDRVSLRLLESVLARAGHRVVAASDGEEALALALKVGPQVVVTDWTMPRMDGIGLCRALRRYESGRATYLIMLTGTEAEDRLVEAFEAGADDYVTKPFKPRVLLARIRAARRVLELQDQVARDHQQMQEQLAELGVLTRRLQRASLTDPLTQLGNRRQAMERLAAAWNSATESGEALSLIMADLDHFKCVNDEHGHDVGDLVLKESANVLRTHTRETEDLCRIGGEEFLLICPGTGLEGGIACAERLRSSLERHSIHAPGFSQRITASLGVALRTPDMRNPDALLKAADLAVYEAKRLGRNRVSMYEPAAPVV